MKNLFCKCLAACLCMKPQPSPPPEPTLISMRRLSVATVERLSNKYENVNVSSLETTETEPGNKVMKEIRDLLREILDLQKTRQQDEQEEEIKNDWMLAAAVLDRICAFVFTIIFVAGTVAFIVLIAAHHD